MRYLVCLIAVITLLTSCGSHATSGDPAAATPGIGQPPADALGALPTDGVQPWESLDSRGHVIPQHNDSVAAASRRSSAMPPDSEFDYGFDRFLEGGIVTDEGNASNLNGGAVGGKQLSYAMYRLTMAGAQPGTLALDVNLFQRTGAPGVSEYWVAVSDYDAGHWRWLGPFSDGQLTLQLPAGDYLSGLGNTFVAIATYDGNGVAVLGVMASQLDGADTTAPPAPAAPALTPVAGGLEMQWLGVIAGDLAGYRILYSYSPFSSPADPGVKQWTYLENTTRFVLPLQARTAFVALQAVDVSGNASAIGPVSNALPLPGSVPSLDLDIGFTTVKRNAADTITFSGADLFDIDTDGDGDFDVTDFPAGSIAVDTSNTGISRPRVRGHNAGGGGVALGSVSLIVSGNSRPVASARVDVAGGVVPIAVNFLGDGTDEDGTIIEWAWDRTGDGIYERISAVDPDTTGNFSAAGTYNAKLRVTDDQGAWDVDTVTIDALEQKIELKAVSQIINAGDIVFLSVVSNRLITLYEWDLDLDATYELNTGTDSFTNFPEGRPGINGYGCRVTLDTGDVQELIVGVLVHGWTRTTGISGASGGAYSSAAIVHGVPAVAYYDNTTNGLSYVRAIDSVGSIWNTPVVVDNPGNIVGYWPSLVVVDGQPAVAYMDVTASDLLYCRATDADGAAWGLPQPLDTTNAVGPFASMAIIDGNPTIAYQDSTAANPTYIRALDADGFTWGAPVYAVASGDADGFYTSLAEVNGAPAISYGNTTTPAAYYVRSTDADGVAWAAPVAPMSGAPSGTSLVVVNGRPAISCCHAATGTLRYIRANDSTGATWPINPLLVDAASPTGYNCTMAVVASIPMIAYQSVNSGITMLARANGPDGNGWVLEQVAPAGTMSSPLRLGLCEVNGLAAISSPYDSFNLLDFSVRY